MQGVFFRRDAKKTRVRPVYDVCRLSGLYDGQFGVERQKAAQEEIWRQRKHVFRDRKLGKDRASHRHRRSWTDPGMPQPDEIAHLPYRVGRRNGAAGPGHARRFALQRVPRRIENVERVVHEANFGTPCKYLGYFRDLLRKIVIVAVKKTDDI